MASAPIAARWPTNDPGLTRAQRLQLQILLLKAGYDIGEADGKIGPVRWFAIYHDFTADGSVAEVLVEVNENVQAGQGIVTLTSGARTKVEVAIPSTLIAGVSEGDTVDVRFDALAGRSFAATVTEVGVAASGSTTFPVTPSPSATSRSGQTALW